MPVAKGITSLLEAIPARIEVAGHEPTWRVTGESFDSALDFARESYDEPAVVEVSVRHRWWARVTLTVTTDPQLAAAAPPVEALRAQVEDALRAAEQPDQPDQSEQTDRSEQTGQPAQANQPGHTDQPEQPAPTEGIDESALSPLDAIFTHQEQLRVERANIPRQPDRSAIRGRSH